MDSNTTSTTAAQAFKLISNDFRVSILSTLAQSDTPLSFSELMDELDEPDSGRLNYHLDQLRGRYVTKGDGDYRLTIQGAKIVSSIRASRYVEDEATYSVPAPGRCYECGASALHVEQIGQQAIIRCQDCGYKQFRKSVTTALWKHRDDSDVPTALNRIIKVELELAMNQICGYCHSTMRPRVAENNWDQDADLYGLYDFDAVAVYECDLCTNWKLAPHGLVAWFHPEVRSFHQKFGVDPDAVMCWQIDQGIDDEYTSIRSTDPYEIDVRFPLDNAECCVTFNDRNEIVQVAQQWDCNPSG